MPFTVSNFARIRLWLYHLTAASNFERIRRRLELLSAASLFELAGQSELLRERRGQSHTVAVGGELVHVRDQAPLHEKSIALEPGWTYSDLVELLNRQVFFWPGGDRGPGQHGIDHFERYRGEAPCVLRVPTTLMLATNPRAVPAAGSRAAGAEAVY